MEKLDAVEIRVLGALMEKEMTTPDYYPMTLNALTNACNQKSNRNPVMNLDEKDVVQALDVLRQNQLAMRIISTEYRTPKYEHTITDKFGFLPEEKAILCVLFLRGPQTLGEIRARSARMHETDLESIRLILEKLKSREDGPFIKRLPVVPGHKERRFVHLLGDVPVVPERSMEGFEGFKGFKEKAVLEVRSEKKQVEELRQELEQTRKELAELTKKVNDFIAQFE